MLRLRFCMSLCWLVALLLLGCSNVRRNPDELVAKSAKLIQAAEEAQKDSYARSYALYKRAIDALESIASKHPGSQEAILLAQGEMRAGPYTLSELKQSVVPEAKSRADAEQHPLACALFVAVRIAGQERSFALCDIAQAYAKAGLTEKAIEVADLVGERDRERQALTLACAARECAQRGRNSEAARILARAVQAARLIPAQPRPAFELALIAELYCKIQEYDRALAVAEGIEPPAQRASTLTGIAGSLVDAGQGGRALRLLEQACAAAAEMDDPCDQVSAWGGIAYVYLGVGERDKATHLLAQARDTVRKIESSLGKAYALADLVPPYLLAGRKDVAGKLACEAERLEDADRGGYACDIAESVFQSYEAAHEYDALAALIYNGAVMYPLYDGKANRAHGLVVAASMYAEAGLREKALRNLRQARELLETLEQSEVDSKAEVLLGMISVWLSLGDRAESLKQFTQALDAANAVPDRLDKALALRYLLPELAKAGQHEQAFGLAKGIEEPCLRAEALADIARQHAEAKPTDRSLEMLATALEAARSNQPGYCRDLVLWDVACGYAAAGLTIRAVGVCASLHESKKKWNGMRRIAKICTNAERYNEALEVAKVIDDPYTKADALTAIGGEYLGRGLSVDEPARRVLHEIVACSVATSHREASE